MLSVLQSIVSDATPNIPLVGKNLGTFAALEHRDIKYPCGSFLREWNVACENDGIIDPTSSPVEGPFGISEDVFHENNVYSHEKEAQAVIGLVALAEDNEYSREENASISIVATSAELRGESTFSSSDYADQSDGFNKINEYLNVANNRFGVYETIDSASELGKRVNGSGTENRGVDRGAVFDGKSAFSSLHDEDGIKELLSNDMREEVTYSAVSSQAGEQSSVNDGSRETSYNSTGLNSSEIRETRVVTEQDDQDLLLSSENATGAIAVESAECFRETSISGIIKESLHSPAEISLTETSTSDFHTSNGFTIFLDDYSEDTTSDTFGRNDPILGIDEAHCAHSSCCSSGSVFNEPVFNGVAMSDNILLTGGMNTEKECSDVQTKKNMTTVRDEVGINRNKLTKQKERVLFMSLFLCIWVFITVSSLVMKIVCVNFRKKRAEIMQSDEKYDGIEIEFEGEHVIIEYEPEEEMT